MWADQSGWSDEGLLTMRTVGPREKREPRHEAGLRQPLKNLFCHIVNKKSLPSSGSTFLLRGCEIVGFGLLYNQEFTRSWLCQKLQSLAQDRERQNEASCTAPPFRYSASSL